MSVTARIAAWDTSTPAAPLSGLSPTWHEGKVKVAATGADATAPADPVDLGNGEYLVTIDGNLCGVVDLGSTAAEQYILVQPTDGTIVVLALDATTGEPKTGITTAGWNSWIDDAGSPVTPQPTYAPIGLGMYRVIPDAADTTGHGFTDLTSAVKNRYQAVTQPPGTGPTVTQSPASGTAIGATDAITVKVRGKDADLVAIQLKAFWTTLGGGATNRPWEMVHDGADFDPVLYAGSTRTAVTDSDGAGFDYVLRRQGGWPGGLTTEIETYAADEAGSVIP